MDTQVYVAMALNGAPEWFRTDFQRELKDALRELPGVTVLDFFWQAKGRNPQDSTEVYLWDKERTEAADLCVFIADYASTGMGQEFEIRVNAQKPALAFYQAGNDTVSNMFLGACRVHGVPAIAYNAVADIVASVEEWRHQP